MADKLKPINAEYTKKTVANAVYESLLKPKDITITAASGASITKKIIGLAIMLMSHSLPEPSHATTPLIKRADVMYVNTEEINARVPACALAPKASF